jgi:dTDP-4-dehydrorhamnose 3,5-epimerase
MPIQLSKTSISELTLIIPHKFSDERGFIKKYFEESVFAENKLPYCFSECNVIMSHYGVLRGLHYQHNPSQGKLISVLKGYIFMVAVDLRYNFETFGKYETFYLTDDNDIAVYVPENFAIGTLSLYDAGSLVSYQCFGKYIPENNNGIVWNDKTLNIIWPIDKLNAASLIVSDKDKKLQTFEEFKTGR